MERYEYKIVPAPTHGTKKRGLKKPEDKFALTIEQVMNELAQDGWEYQRSEKLPHEYRSGLTGRTTTQQNVLVFRRPVLEADLEQKESPKSQELSATKSDDTSDGAPAPEPGDKFFAGGKFRQ